MLRNLLRHQRPVTPPAFRWRSSEVSRLEELSDAVIGFALTLLVVSLEVPQTFDALLHTLRGFPVFAFCFALLIVIWHEHYTFFRRYGLQDTATIVWNTVLLFVIVVYVYPLKFLFTLVFTAGQGSGTPAPPASGPGVPMIHADQLSQLYLLYGIGWSAVWLVFAVLYRHALTQGRPLELTALEVFDTRASMREHLAAACVGLVSIGLALVGATSVAGWVYLGMFPLIWVLKRRTAQRRQRLERAGRRSRDTRPPGTTRPNTTGDRTPP